MVSQMLVFEWLLALGHVRNILYQNRFLDNMTKLKNQLTHDLTYLTIGCYWLNMIDPQPLSVTFFLNSRIYMITKE